MNKKRIKVGILTFGIVLILNAIFKQFDAFYLNFYLKGAFQVIRVVFDYSFGLLPISMIYVIVPLFFYYFLNKNFSNWKSFLAGLGAALIWIVNLFYITWGFNYTQGSAYKLLSMSRVQLDSLYIQKAFEDQTKILESLKPGADTAYHFYTIQGEIRSSQEQLLQNWDFPTAGRVQVRKLLPGMLLHFRTSGIYIPHAFQGHLDKGLYYKQHPFTIAHEMAHGYGITDESVCNFVAYLTCKNVDNPLIRYSAELAYWRYLAKYYRYYFPEEYKVIREGLSAEVQNDLAQINAHISKYKDWMPALRDLMYDNYLKTHGVKAGIRSYDQMIQLIASYNLDPEAPTLRR
ncbi:MAG: DUF3810 family protein [Saprospiraceae bacterium]|nr:DUF3810 family protein [Saprospiraceae bacterium]